MRKDAGTTRADADPNVRSLSRLLVATVTAGGALAAGALALHGLRSSVGVAAGALLATANLWVLSRVVGALLGRGGRPTFWTLVGTGKVVALFGVVYLLVIARLADILPLVLGFGALPLGILLASLVAAAPEDEPG